MTETQFTIPAEKFSERIDVLVKRVEHYIRTLEAHETEWTKSNTDKKTPSYFGVYFAPSNPWTYVLASPRKQLSRLEALQRGVNLQIDLGRGPGWDSRVMVSISDTELIYHWLHSYVDVNRVIKMVQETMVDEKISK